MAILKSVRAGLTRLLAWLEDLLAPEDKRIAGLLDIEAGAMRLLLPKSPVNMRDVFVLFDYHNKIVRLLVKSIKYKNNQGLRRRVAKYIHEELMEMSSDIALFEGSPPLLVPTPMSKAEKAKKGFNQCEELAKEAGRLAAGSIQISYDALKKIKETKRQTTLSREERLLNVRGCMQANPRLVGDRVVIVLDDVYTTGATMQESQRALKEAGARRVIHFFIAH